MKRLWRGRFSTAQTPVISAVGHETDVTIADYVADLRAPTPSAAAELAVFDYRQFESARLSYQAALNQAMERKKELARYRAEQYRLRLKLHDPERKLREQRQRLTDTEDAMKRAMEQKLTAARHRLALLSGQLHGLSPLAKISNGYGFVMDAEGKRRHIRRPDRSRRCHYNSDCRRKNPGAGNGNCAVSGNAGSRAEKPRLRQNILCMAKDRAEQKGADMEKSIEQTFAELDELLEKLESPDTTLEESFACYETGMKLVKACNDKIDKVEKQMIILQGGAEEDGDA